MIRILAAQSIDRRFELGDGAGSDAVHTDPQYGYAVTFLTTDRDLSGTGLAYTLGEGTNLICAAIDMLARPIIGQEIETLMAHFGEVQREIAEHGRLRWLGPHKGVTHLALASITNACFDLWAKSRGLPLWKLLLELTSEQIVNTIDLTYLEDVLPRTEAIEILERNRATRRQRESVLQKGYPGYDTSVGWFRYDDDRLRENARQAVAAGFTAMKLKVGSRDPEDDLRRVHLLREAVGTDIRLMLDANQAWSVPAAVSIGLELASYDPFWIEEPTQPDDVLGHQTLARVLAPVPIAIGESVSNRVLWKNFLLAGAVGIVQADCTRLAGVSEYLAVTIMATKFPVRVVPHIGDMGQIHQHLVLFNHIALNHPRLFLEYIPHLREYFVNPARVENGAYQTPTCPGCSTELHAEP